MLATVMNIEECGMKVLATVTHLVEQSDVCDSVNRALTLGAYMTQSMHSHEIETALSKTKY